VGGTNIQIIHYLHDNWSKCDIISQLFYMKVTKNLESVLVLEEWLRNVTVARHFFFYIGQSSTNFIKVESPIVLNPIVPRLGVYSSGFRNVRLLSTFSTIK
jgi:hypothetical protein